MISYAVLFFGLMLIIILGATTTSSSGGWGNMLLFIVLYLVSVPITGKIARCRHDRILRQSHFLLAVVCRAENNRYYLRRGIELRPGYLARWVEFNVIKLEDG